MLGGKTWLSQVSRGADPRAPTQPVCGHQLQWGRQRAGLHSQTAQLQEALERTPREWGLPHESTEPTSSLETRHSSPCKFCPSRYRPGGNLSLRSSPGPIRAKAQGPAVTSGQGTQIWADPEQVAPPQLVCGGDPRGVTQRHRLCQQLLLGSPARARGPSALWERWIPCPGPCPGRKPLVTCTRTITT